jgi:hypothetical protein
MIATTLTEEQAEMLVLCMRNYDAIRFMADAGVFELKSASATLHFSEAGLAKVEKHTHHFPDRYQHPGGFQVDIIAVSGA